MLSKEQQRVIESLTKKFDELNESYTNVAFSVLNVNKFNIELQKVAKAKEELRIHNQGMLILRKEYENDLALKLNSDFNIGKLPLIAEVSNQSQGNNIISISSKLGTRAVQMIVMIQLKPMIVVNENGGKITGFVYVDSMNEKNEYKTPQKLLSSPEMQKKLIKIAEATIIVEQNKAERLK